MSPFIQIVKESEIETRFSLLAADILARHQETSRTEPKRNTHVMFGADDDQTTALFAELVTVGALAQRKTPGMKMALTFELDNTLYPYAFAATDNPKTSARMRTYQRELEPLHGLMNGYPRAMFFVQSFRAGIPIHFIDVKKIRHSLFSSRIDMDFLNDHHRDFLEDYLTVQCTETEQTVMDRQWDSLDSKRPLGRNLRSAFMAQEDRKFIKKDKGIVVIHSGERDLIKIKDSKGFAAKKNKEMLPVLLHRRDPAANIVLVDLVSVDQPEGRLIRSQSEGIHDRLTVLHYALPEFSAQKNGILKPSKDVQSHWNGLCFSNSVLNYIY